MLELQAAYEPTGGSAGVEAQGAARVLPRFARPRSSRFARRGPHRRWAVQSGGASRQPVRRTGPNGIRVGEVSEVWL